MDHSLQNIRTELEKLVEKDYQKFASRLIPNSNNLLGVRVPNLRKMAKEIAKGDWENYLLTASDTYFEEVMLQGMVIGVIKIDIEERFKLIAGYVPKINNWSLCDSFCTGLKCTKENKSEVWQFLQPYFKSEQPYDVRFGVVMSLSYYIETNYIKALFEIFNEINQQDYYVKMSVAWAISICYIHFPEITMNYLKANTLDKFTYQKSLQKIIESQRVSIEEKKIIKKMKKDGLNI